MSRPASLRVVSTAYFSAGSCATGLDTLKSHMTDRWIPPAERPAAKKKAALDETRAIVAIVETDAALARAQQAKDLVEIQSDALALVRAEVKKWLRLSESPDFANAIGPVEPAILLKLAELIMKYARVDAGMATENHAHAHAHTDVDFSKLTQDERNAWLAMAAKMKR